MPKFKQRGTSFVIDAVDARTSEAHCSRCRTRILWIVMPSGSKMPLDLNTAEPMDNGELRCVSHFATCPKAAEFRDRSKRPKSMCPVDGCKRSVREHDMLCADCWKLVPKNLRDEVWRTWKARETGPRETWKAYESTAAAAIAAANASKANRNVRQLDAFGDRAADPG